MANNKDNTPGLGRPSIPDEMPVNLLRRDEAELLLAGVPAAAIVPLFELHHEACPFPSGVAACRCSPAFLFQVNPTGSVQ
jgi:hypothetical protein